MLRRIINRSFRGIDVNRPPEKLDPEGFQLDLNGDRRRTDAWRQRVGYARFLSGEPGAILNIDESDDFNRADAPDLGPNWTAYGCSTSQPKIVSNHCESTPIVGAQSGAGYSAGSFGNDQASQVTILQVGGTGLTAPGVIVRASSSGAYLLATLSNNYTIRLYRITNWGTCALGSGSVVILDEFTTYGSSPILYAGYKLRLHVNGTTLRGYVNNSLVCYATDSNIASGLPGVFWSGGASGSPNWQIDDWAGGASALGLTSISVNGLPERLVAFDRDDDSPKLVASYGQNVEQFDTGVPEGSS